MEAQLTKKVFTYRWDKDSMRRAEIVFEYSSGLSEGLIFTRCNFTGVKDIYDIDDWMFLKDLATEIERLSKES